MLPNTMPQTGTPACAYRQQARSEASKQVSEHRLNALRSKYTRKPHDNGRAGKTSLLVSRRIVAGTGGDDTLYLSNRAVDQAQTLRPSVTWWAGSRSRAGLSGRGPAHGSRQTERWRRRSANDAGSDGGAGGSTEVVDKEDADVEGAAGSWWSTALGLGIPILFLGTGVYLGWYYGAAINHYLEEFSVMLDSMGPSGIALYMAVYICLELLAIPAIPLTMTAGALFGVVKGTVIASLAAATAASIAFLLARSVARERFRGLAQRYPKFQAIDKAIGNDSFRVVVLLRLSPLLPFALSNYLYGLTSVELTPYMLGSWIGMLPGTFTYVNAGSVGRSMLSGAGAGSSQIWMIAASLIVSVFAATYITKLASQATKDM